MDTKLTIRLDDQVIQRAKEYAKKHRISLSRMIEAYLDSLTQDEVKEMEISPLVESLSGVIQLEEEIDIRGDYSDYLDKKYE